MVLEVVERRGAADIARVGDVVLADVKAPKLGRIEPRVRPCVIVAETKHQDTGARSWKLMGLTKLATYADGTPRVAIPNWQAAGLNGPGFLWGPRTPYVPDDQLVSVIGTCPRDLRAVIGGMVRLTRSERLEFLS